MDRNNLGRCVRVSNPTSAVAVLDYSGVGDAYRELIGLVTAAQEEWRMLQEDTLLNPRPAMWVVEHQRELALMEERRKERAKNQLKHEQEFARAEAQRRAHNAAKAAARGNRPAKKKKKNKNGGGIGSERELKPLPVINEDEKRRRKWKNKRGEAAVLDATPSSATAVAAPSNTSLKGAGRALNEIAQTMAEDKKEKGKQRENGAKTKSQKKHDTYTTHTPNHQSDATSSTQTVAAAASSAAAAAAAPKQTNKNKPQRK